MSSQRNNRFSDPLDIQINDHVSTPFNIDNHITVLKEYEAVSISESNIEILNDNNLLCTYDKSFFLRIDILHGFRILEMISRLTRKTLLVS